MPYRIEQKNEIHAEDVFRNRIRLFQKLMQHKVRDILLVSSLYDFYLFEEDGRLYELIREEYQTLNLSWAPEITHVTTGEEALNLLKTNTNYEIIVTTMHIEDMHVMQLAQKIREVRKGTPLILLAYDNRERKELTSQYDTSIFDRLFIWQGDYKLMMGIVKYVEDRLNLENDTKSVGVQSIILVEDNVKFYSSYLPLIYTEVFKQSQRLISEGVNITHKFLRMRARPKILLCTTYEEAWKYYEKYEEYILGIITDNNFKYNNVRDPEAGMKFAKTVKERQNDIPILLQSSNAEYAEVARSIGVSFLQKGSPRLLHNLRQFMLDNFGFGDFIFRVADGREVGRAQNLKSLEEQLEIIPAESIVYHAERNHFSKWFKARTEFWLAHKLRPKKVSEFRSPDHLRAEILESIRTYTEERTRGTITEFTTDLFDPINSFARIGSGSLGGKARGLGFINTLINSQKIRYKFEGIEISVPSAVVIATDVFDRFIEENKLEPLAYQDTDDKELLNKFIEAKYFPPDIIEKLVEFLDTIREPLAVRSSSLLEDSQFQPFAGVYQTYMIPNNNPDPTIRLNQLLECVKAIYASTFFRNAKDYLKATAYRMEEEKMAVIVQRLVGAHRENRFYPDFAGVAKSYNFYPAAPQKSSDGIAYVALGLGKTVVEGGNSVRFCPKYPKHLLQFFSVKETIRNAQQEFYALETDDIPESSSEYSPERFVKKYDLAVAEKDQTLSFVGSTYSTENEAVYDGISRRGKRVVTFASVLKHKTFPLADILNELIELGTWGIGVPIELEFAVNLNVPQNSPKQFELLQMRPLVISHEKEELDVEDVAQDGLLCQSKQVLGNGVITNIFDVVYVDIQKYDRGKSRLVATEVGKLNSKLVSEKRPYLLIGVGRWGSLDPWLGIPVTWDQIAGACVIVESGFKDWSVAPSQGSHFFQNITSFRIGYFTVNSSTNEDFIDWVWLSSERANEKLEFTRHLRFDEPVIVKISGHKNKGIIIKPGVIKS